MTTPEQDTPLLGLSGAGLFWASPSFFWGFPMLRFPARGAMNGSEERLDLILEELRGLRQDLSARPALPEGTVELREVPGLDAAAIGKALAEELRPLIEAATPARRRK